MINYKEKKKPVTVPEKDLEPNLLDKDFKTTVLKMCGESNENHVEIKLKYQ